jgi:hypothetical protein
MTVNSNESFWHRTIGVQWQRKYIIKLNTIYDLKTPGIYYISATWNRNLSSGTAYFTIVDNYESPAATKNHESNKYPSNIGRNSNDIDLSSIEVDAEPIKSDRRLVANLSSDSTASAVIEANRIRKETLVYNEGQMGQPWRHRIGWSMLSFAFLAVAVIFYRAYRRGVRKKG